MNDDVNLWMYVYWPVDRPSDTTCLDPPPPITGNGVFGALQKYLKMSSV